MSQAVMRVSTAGLRVGQVVDIDADLGDGMLEVSDGLGQSHIVMTGDLNLPRQYAGRDGEIIAYATDVWLQTADGSPVDLADAISQARLPLADSSCDQCEGSAMNGVIAPMNSEFGIERCDQCEIYLGDFEAAAALVAALGGGLTIWYLPSEWASTD